MLRFHLLLFTNVWSVSTMLAEMLLLKYEYHVPFYRQVKEFRHLGVRLSESILIGWFKPVYELLRPLYDELVRQIIGYWYVQAGGTTVRVISKGKADKEYLWMLKAVMEKLVIFHDDNGSREYTLEKQRKLWNRQSPHPCRISLKSG